MHVDIHCVNLRGGLPVECDVCGRVGLYPTEEAATQMIDVHLVMHVQGIAAGNQPVISVLPWLPIEPGA